MLLATGLAATWFGCEAATDVTVPTPQSSPVDSAPSEFTLVTLKVPNMT